MYDLQSRSDGRDVTYCLRAIYISLYRIRPMKVHKSYHKTVEKKIQRFAISFFTPYRKHRLKINCKVSYFYKGC